MPELNKMYPGDPLKLAAFPHLKHIVQLGHDTIRGVMKFKDIMVYANPNESHLEIPDNSAEDGAFDSYRGGK